MAHEHPCALARRRLLRLREQLVVGRRQAEDEVAGPKRHHRRGRALACLDALAGIPRPPSAAAPPRARPPSRRRCRRRSRCRVERAQLVDPRAEAAAPPRRPRAPAASALAAPRRRDLRPHASAATTLPQNACVWVTARCSSTVTSARAPTRETIVDPGVEVIATTGGGRALGRLDQVAELARRGDRRRTSPSRQRKAPRARRPLGTATTSGPARPSSEASQSAMQT